MIDGSPTLKVSESANLSQLIQSDHPKRANFCIFQAMAKFTWSSLEKKPLLDRSVVIQQCNYVSIQENR